MPAERGAEHCDFDMTKVKATIHILFCVYFGLLSQAKDALVHHLADTHTDQGKGWFKMICGSGPQLAGNIFKP